MNQLKVHLTFDVEIWCNGWGDLDDCFPSAFERYVYGRSKRGEFALPKTLEILNRFGISAVFFVEPLFSARFGDQYLEQVVRLIRSAGQDVQLHLHPEWVDEISPPPIADASVKRQHLTAYSLDEQVALIRYGADLLRRHNSERLYAFRAGSYAANGDTYLALQQAGLTVDSSLNRCSADSWPGLPARDDDRSSFRVGPVQVYPVTVFRDGIGRERPLQITACGLEEMRQVLRKAHATGREHVVLVSHNFEMLRRERSEPDPFVVRRFEGLCAFLNDNRDRFITTAFDEQPRAAEPTAEVTAGFGSTFVRLGEQLARRSPFM